MKPGEKRRYAGARLKAALDYQLGLLRKELTKKHGLTDKEKLEAIRNGDVDLKRAAKLTDTLESAFDFRNLEPCDSLDQDAYDKAALVLRQEAATIWDMLMLNTVAEDDAVKALVKFCKDCPGV